MMKLLVDGNYNDAIQDILRSVLSNGLDAIDVAKGYKDYIPENPYGFLQDMGKELKAGSEVFDKKLSFYYDKVRGSGTNSGANLLKGGYRRKHRKTGRKSRKHRKTRRN